MRLTNRLKTAAKTAAVSAAVIFGTMSYSSNANAQLGMGFSLGAGKLDSNQIVEFGVGLHDKELLSSLSFFNIVHRYEEDGKHSTGYEPGIELKVGKFFNKESIPSLYADLSLGISSMSYDLSRSYDKNLSRLNRIFGASAGVALKDDDFALILSYIYKHTSKINDKNVIGDGLERDGWMLSGRMNF